MGKLIIVRLIFAGAFALIALTGAVLGELLGHPAPDWLIALVATAGGYIFGHVQANGKST